MKGREILGTTVLAATFAGAALLATAFFFAPRSRQDAFLPLHRAARGGSTEEVTVHVPSPRTSPVSV